MTHRRPSVIALAGRFWPWLGLLLLAATALRFVGLAHHPASDWDESNYFAVSRNFAEHGDVAAKTPYGQTHEVYLYNPVFYFWIVGTWFRLVGPSLLHARWIAAGASVLTLLMLGLMLRSVIGKWALLAVGLLALDGWMIFTNRVGWMENLGFAFAVGGLWLYERALAKPTIPRFLATGLVLAWATVFKHQFGYFIVAVLICWIVLRKHHREHLVMFGVIIAGGALYLVAMLTWHGTDYRREMGGQVMRLLGEKSSRGSVTGSGQLITALENQYAIYFGMLVGLAVAGTWVVYRMVQIAWRLTFGYAREWRRFFTERTIRHRWDYAFERVSGNALLFAWAAATFICFVLTAKVRLAHYTFLVIVPLYCYLAAELKDYVQRKPWSAGRKLATASLVLVVAGSGLFATYERMATDSRDAFAQTAVWIDQNVPAGSLVITEEPIGNNTPDNVTYCKMDHAAACEKAAQYLVVYETITFQPPDSPAIVRMRREGTQLAQFRDFKATITVYRLPPRKR